MNTTPNSNRKHIAIFGNTNAGKSSLMNVLCNQDVSLVSEIKGTTTDPVRKAMELIPFGPVLFIDTAGLNDSTALGDIRIKKSKKILSSSDLAIYVMDGKNEDYDSYVNMKELFKTNNITSIDVINKWDLLSNDEKDHFKHKYKDALYVSAIDTESISILKDKIIKILSLTEEDISLTYDLCKKGSTILLVTPIDAEAPKGRLILPQVQIIRDALDNGFKCIVIKETELKDAIDEFKNVHFVITDSKVFKFVENIIPKNFKLTSFSILMARQKGGLRQNIEGMLSLEGKRLKKVLIAEACTHSIGHDDIGNSMIPNILKKKYGEDITIDFCKGSDFPEDLKEYDLVIHCGGCMINRRSMLSRVRICEIDEVPIVNYGIFLAHSMGILHRCIRDINY